MSTAQGRPLLVRAMLDPAHCNGLSLQQWDLLVRQARRANLLAALGGRLRAQGLNVSVPARVWLHFESALLLAARQSASVQAEVRLIGKALAELATPVVLLKGAAYLLSGHAASAGRLFSDIDILVMRPRIAEVETALMVHGWDFAELDDYDQRYYRRWMHELPPMHHTRRGTALDVHHTILPPTAKTRVNTAALFEDLVALPGLAPLHVLSPEAMLLHSATHLLHEGEMDHGLRDLFDLDAQLRGLGGAAMDWQRLLDRARALGLARVLYLALRYTRVLLGTPMPEPLLLALQAVAPGRLAKAALDFAYTRGLRPQHASCTLPGSGLALSGLYVRSHWLRMPAHLLAYHLGRKALHHLRTDKTEPA